MSKTDYTCIGNWEGKPVNLRTKEDAAAIEVIRTLQSVVNMQKARMAALQFQVEALESENAQLIAEKDNSPQIILNS